MTRARLKRVNSVAKLGALPRDDDKHRWVARFKEPGTRPYLYEYIAAKTKREAVQLVRRFYPKARMIEAKRTTGGAVVYLGLTFGRMKWAGVK